MDIVISTDRLDLCLLHDDDAGFILTLLNTKGWLQFIGDKQVKSMEQAMDYLKNGPYKSYDTHGYGLWKIIEKTSKITIGLCGFLKRDFLDHPDIGYALLPDYQGHGYAGEAALAVCRYGQHHYHFEKIYALIHPDNIRSIKLIEKLGFVFDRSTFHNEQYVLLYQRSATSMVKHEAYAMA